MNFNNTYSNSTAITDQSAKEFVDKLKFTYNIDCYSFLSNQNVSFATTDLGAKEQSYQTRVQSNLFVSGYIEKPDTYTIDKTNYVFSSMCGSVTLGIYDSWGTQVFIYNSSKITKPLLWDHSKYYKKLLRRNSVADISLINLARFIKERKFVFTNDQIIINQLKLENIKYLRPIHILIWMVCEKFLTFRKAKRVFKEINNADGRVFENGKTFEDYYKIINKLNKHKNV